MIKIFSVEQFPTKARVCRAKSGSTFVPSKQPETFISKVLLIFQPLSLSLFIKRTVNRQTRKTVISDFFYRKKSAKIDTDYLWTPTLGFRAFEDPRSGS